MRGLIWKKKQQKQKLYHEKKQYCTDGSGDNSYSKWDTQ